MARITLDFEYAEILVTLEAATEIDRNAADFKLISGSDFAMTVLMSQLESATGLRNSTVDFESCSFEDLNYCLALVSDTLNLSMTVNDQPAVVSLQIIEGQVL